MSCSWRLDDHIEEFMPQNTMTLQTRNAHILDWLGLIRGVRHDSHGRAILFRFLRSNWESRKLHVCTCVIVLLLVLDVGSCKSVAQAGITGSCRHEPTNRSTKSDPAGNKSRRSRTIHSKPRQKKCLHTHNSETLKQVRKCRTWSHACGALLFTLGKQCVQLQHYIRKARCGYVHILLKTTSKM